MANQNYPIAAAAIFNLFKNSAIRSADPENPILEPNIKWIGSPVAELWRAPLERAMVVSYKLSIVTIALSVTIQLQFAIECLRRSNQQGVGHFGPNLGCSP